MKKPYRKIARYVKMGAAGIPVSFMISLVPLILFDIYLEKFAWVGAVIALPLWFLLYLAIYKIFQKLIAIENKKRKKYIALRTPRKQIEELFKVEEHIKVANGVDLFVYEEGMLNTVALYSALPDFQLETRKRYRGVANAYLKRNYAAARESSNHKKHHALKVQLFACNEEQAKEFFFHKNYEQLTEIGFIEGLWIIDRGKIVLCNFTGRDMEYFTLNFYQYAVKKLVELFSVTSIEELEEY